MVLGSGLCQSWDTIGSMPSPLRAWPLRLWAAETAHITRALRWLPWAQRKPLLLTAALNVILVGLGAGVVKRLHQHCHEGEAGRNG